MMMVQIAVVQRGDSLWSIATNFGVPLEAIVNTNEIAPETPLVIGQSIVIPTMNRLLLRSLIEVNAYIRANDPNAVNIVAKYAPYVTYFSVSSYRVLENGDLTSLDDVEILAAIEKTNSVPMLVVTNFTGQRFSPEITRELFTNEAAKNRFVSNLVTIVREKKYAAINIDFEENYPEDRELYNEFLRNITPILKQEGVLVSTTLAPKVSASEPVAWFGGLDHDYEAHGQIVDFVNIMTYDMGGWFSGPPLPVSPITTMREVLNYATSVIPKEKIMLGLPLYGYDWKLPFDPDVDFAETIGPREAVDLAREKGADIQYNYIEEAPFFTYFDEIGNEHIVWFEDARSMKAKLNLINEYSLLGASYFILGRRFPENWALLTEMFTIEKQS